MSEAYDVEEEDGDAALDDDNEDEDEDNDQAGDDEAERRTFRGLCLLFTNISRAIDPTGVCVFGGKQSTVLLWNLSEL